MRVAVMGAGSWGSVFSMILSDANCDVTLWARSSAVADDINSTHINHAYQPDLILPTNVLATTNPDQALAGADLVVLAMPAQTLRSNLSSWSASIPSQAVMVSLIKGVELGTAERMTEVIAEVANVSPEQVAVVSGPNLAHEIAAKEPAATTVACANEVFAKRIQDACT
ncbi:MAG: putative NAD(P)H-dependent glycerol-3-phosphate dehydrogenase, partial [Actinomycetota bacterium]